MTIDIKTCCQWRMTDGQPWNPIQAKTKTGLEWVPVIRYGPGGLV